MADNVYQLNFKLNSGDIKSLQFTAPQGSRGKSAYAYAQEGGYSGTESQFAQEINPDNLKSLAVQELVEQLQGLPVFGVVDENNTITVSSMLVAGTYTLKYENDEGVTEEIGTIVIGTGDDSEHVPNTDIVWDYETKINTDGSQTSDTNYGASSYIEIISGYRYTVHRESSKNKATGIKICYYNGSKNYISTSVEICSAANKEATADIPLIAGAKYFKLRVNSGSGGTPDYLDGITVTATKE